MFSYPFCLSLCYAYFSHLTLILLTYFSLMLFHISWQSPFSFSFPPSLLFLSLSTLTYSPSHPWYPLFLTLSSVLPPPLPHSLFCPPSSSPAAKLVVRWADITQLEKIATLLLPDVIRVCTRSNDHVFSVFLNIAETFKLMEQLANIAMRQLLDNKGFEQDRSLPKLKKKSPKKVSALKRSELVG